MSRECGGGERGGGGGGSSSGGGGLGGGGGQQPQRRAGGARTSWKPITPSICSQPATGTLATAPSAPAAVASAKETPADGESMPSKWVPVEVHAQPTHASIATRECLSSAARSRLRFAWSALPARSNGSQILSLISVDAPTMSLSRALVGPLTFTI